MNLQTVKPRARWSRILQVWKVYFPDQPHTSYYVMRGSLDASLRHAIASRLTKQSNPVV